MTTRAPVLCRACSRFKPSLGTCEAFPKGIPSSILLYGGDHRTPVPGDQGITFLLDDKQSQSFTDWLSFYRS